MPRTVAFIPVRGGSKSIPLKNIKPLCGRPLVYWTAAAAAGCARIDEVFVATDSDAIREAVEGCALEKVSVIGRSPESATDGASTESAMIEFAEARDFETIVLVQATSPLLTSRDIERGFERYDEPGVDGVLSVVEDKRFYWREGPGGAVPINYDHFARPRRQDFDGCLMENGAFYITSRERLLETGNRLSGRIAASVMPPETAYEIDEPDDWAIIERLLLRRIRKEEAGPDFSGVRMLLTDCDGCLTDAGMYYSERGDELKKFNTRDGMAFALLRERGIKVGIVTGEDSASARRRGEKLRADHIVTGCRDKLSAVRAICAEEGISLSEVAYVGDDFNAVEVLRAVGMPCCPADAQRPAREVAAYISERRGGQGVIRDVAEQILAAIQTE